MTLSNHSPGKTIAAHYQEAVQWRRQLHRNPQPAWLEFYSTGFVAEKLAGWGYDLLLGERYFHAALEHSCPVFERLEREAGGRRASTGRR